MNTRIRASRRSSPTLTESFHRYLKPGALAQMRDSRISARSHRVSSISQIYSLRTLSSPLPSSPPSSNAGGQPTVSMIDGFPCFSGRVYGPRCPQRKKLVAAKSVWFPILSSPGSPASESPPDPIMDVFGSDIVAAH